MSSSSLKPVNGTLVYENEDIKLLGEFAQKGESTDLDSKCSSLKDKSFL